MIKYDDNYIDYLGELSLLDFTKSRNLITDREYVNIKKAIMNKYKIQDL